MAKKKVKAGMLAKGRKLTKGRQEILTGIEEIEGHFDSQMLYERLKAGGAKISRASVYRTMPVLVESGVIREVERIDKRSHYEKMAGKQHHDHLICLSCGRTIEFYSPTLEMLQNEVCDREGFQVLRHSLEIQGYCRDCANSTSP